MVIRDNRIRDLALTPALGRGYSLATNTYQSVCFDNLKTTTASFDFDYSFEDLELDDSTTSRMEGTFKGTDAYDFIKKHTRTKTITRNNHKYYYHHLLATLTVDSYYSSLNEAKLTLSKSAQILLKKKDVLGFFAACGSYYIRSIARRSQYLTIFTYTSKKGERDDNFEENLEQAIRRFDMDKGTTAQETKTSREFADLAQRRNLKIVNRSLALVGKKKDNLIAFDLESYKKTIAAAFMSTQNEFTGRIMSLEIVPWMDNTLFQSLIGIEEVTDLAGRRIPRFEQKLILTENAEFYITVLQVIRNMQNISNKAALCRNIIDRKYMKNGRFLPEYRNRQVISHRSGQLISLERLNEELSKNRLEKLYQAQKSFLRGEGPEFNNGASDCLKHILVNGITRRSYRETPSCDKVIPRLSFAPSDIVDEYCMPALDETSNSK